MHLTQNLVKSSLIFSVIFLGTFSYQIVEAGFGDNVQEIKILDDSDTPRCSVSDSCLKPQYVTVEEGTFVIWQNTDAAHHTIVSGTSDKGKNGLFDSGMISPDDEFSMFFMNVGQFDYFCYVHPWIEGSILVVPEKTVTSSSSSSTPSVNDNYENSDRIDILESNISSLNKRIDSLKLELDSETQRADMLAVEKAMLRMENDELTKELTQKNSIIDNFQTKLDDAAQQIQNLNAIVLEQLKSLKSLSDMITSLR